MFGEGVRVAGDAAEILKGINRPFSGSDMPGFDLMVIVRDGQDDNAHRAPHYLTARGLQTFQAMAQTMEVMDEVGEVPEVEVAHWATERSHHISGCLKVREELTLRCLGGGFIHPVGVMNTQTMIDVIRDRR
jgi:hypothetical protein